MKTIAIIGAGGNAREIESVIRDEGAYEPIGFLVSNIGAGQHDSPVLGTLDWLASNHVDALAMGIGSPSAKLRIGRELKQRFPDIPWPTIVHPRAIFLDRERVQLGEGVIVFPNATVSVNVALGDFTEVIYTAAVGHDSRIGRGCLICPQTTIGGAATLGDGVHVCIGAQILPCRTIGNFAILGAGAVVTQDVEPHITVVGVPAKPILYSSRHHLVTGTASRGIGLA